MEPNEPPLDPPLHTQMLNAKSPEHGLQIINFWSLAFMYLVAHIKFFSKHWQTSTTPDNVLF